MKCRLQRSMFRCGKQRAICLLVVGIISWLAISGCGRTESPARQQVIAAFEGWRPLRARLTGGFGFASCGAQPELDNTRLSVFCKGEALPGSATLDELTRIQLRFWSSGRSRGRVGAKLGPTPIEARQVELQHVESQLLMMLEPDGESVERAMERLTDLGRSLPGEDAP